MIHKTKGNGKLDLIDSFNTNPLRNEFCLRMSMNPNTVCSVCYSMKTMKRWVVCQKSLDNNIIELSETVLPISELPKINALYFRFSSHGELINKRHLINLLKICRKNPKVQFAIWSKRFDLFESLSLRHKPKNLIVIYSSPIINVESKIPNEYFDKVFTVFTETYIKDVNLYTNCNGKCINCLVCYTKSGITHIKELIK